MTVSRKGSRRKQKNKHQYKNKPGTSGNEKQLYIKPITESEDATSGKSRASSAFENRSISSRRGKRLRALVIQAQWRKALQNQNQDTSSEPGPSENVSVTVESRGKRNLKRLVKAMHGGKSAQSSCRSHNVSDKLANSCSTEKGTPNDAHTHSINEKIRDENFISQQQIPISPGHHSLNTTQRQRGSVSKSGSKLGSVGSENARLDIKVITMWFSDSLMEPSDIEINFYIMGYEELHKMSNVLGPIFKVVGSEIRSKLDRMIELQNRDTNRHYFSMMSMVAYEVGTQLISTPGFESGCRTFLRLNRGLEFLAKFLDRITKMEPGEVASAAACDVYYETLAQHHKWLHRKSALMLLSLGLPVKEILIQRMCGNNSKEAIRDLPKMLDPINEVINRAHAHFKSNNILDLS